MEPEVKAWRVTHAKGRRGTCNALALLSQLVHVHSSTLVYAYHSHNMCDVVRTHMFITAGPRIGHAQSEGGGKRGACAIDCYERRHVCPS